MNSIKDLILDNLPLIATVLGSVFGGLWVLLKKLTGKATLIADAMIQIGDVLEKFAEVVADEKVTNQEIKEVKKEVKEAIEAVRKLLGSFLKKK